MNAAILFLLSLAAAFGRRALILVVDLPVEASTPTTRVVKLLPTPSTSKPVNLIGRCKAGCKRATCVVDALPVHATLRRGEAHSGTDAMISAEGKVYIRGISGKFRATCACGEVVALAPVEGKFSPVHVCNAKCLNATGPACECSCKGRNHGRNHA